MAIVQWHVQKEDTYTFARWSGTPPDTSTLWRDPCIRGQLSWLSPCVLHHTYRKFTAPAFADVAHQWYPSPCQSAALSEVAKLLHPWNWRLEGILSPLISFIPILSGCFYCPALPFSLGSINGEVVSFCQGNYMRHNISMTYNLNPNRKRLSVLCPDHVDFLHVAFCSFLYPWSLNKKEHELLHLYSSI